MAEQIYTPKIGELVLSDHHEGIYRVLGISDSGMVEVERYIANKLDPVIGVMRVPRRHLKPFNEDGHGQATAKKD